MPPEATGWVAVARLADLGERGRAVVQVGEVEIALFRVDGRVYAIQSRCPHRDGPLIRGFVDPGPGIRCPMHGWRYDLTTGESDRPAKATVYPVRVDGEEIAVLL
jgi:nitrite reductase [NAD(P)H] small subunit